MNARPKGRKGNRKQRWCGFGVLSVQDQEKTAIVEVMMRKPMWKTSPARGTIERVRVKSRSFTFRKADVPTPLFLKSLSVFIMLTIPREKVNKDRRHFAAVTGTKMIDVRHSSRILLIGLISQLLFCQS